MKRLHYLNLFGVLALAALCLTQWQTNRRLNLELIRLDRASQEQADKLTRQEQAAKGAAEDLENFRAQFMRADNDAAENTRQRAALEQQARQLERERDQLKESVTNWANAVSLRDERIKEATARIQSLGEDLKTGARKYNELATNYNATVLRLNELASNYNAVVKQLNEARGAR